MPDVKSWKKQLDDDYRYVLNKGNTKDLDRANEVILQALDRMIDIKKTMEGRKR